MKTFKDLVFKPHAISSYYRYKDAKQAVLYFKNGYGISVLFGCPFHSNGLDTYEVAIIYEGEIVYLDDNNDVYSNFTDNEVTELMIKVQLLK